MELNAFVNRTTEDFRAKHLIDCTFEGELFDRLDFLFGKVVRMGVKAMDVTIDVTRTSV